MFVDDKVILHLRKGNTARWISWLPKLEVKPLSCSAGMEKAGQMPLVAFIALLALPGVLTKQFINCVQLKNAMASLVLHEQQQGRPAKIE